MELRFSLSAEECELLVEFERHHTLQELSASMGKDPSVLSRQLKSLSQKSEVLNKNAGRWELTAKGRRVVAWAKEAIYSQKLILGQKRSIKIATPREFCTRILLPNIKSLIQEEDVAVSLVSSDAGIERLLLSGEADFGLDCGRPREPVIAFKRLVPEPFAVVISPEFAKKHKVSVFADLAPHGYLKFARSENAVQDLLTGPVNYFGTFSDLSALREACVLGHGWGILPYYAVAKEIKEKKLISLPGAKIADETYGVWWNRERGGKELLAWVEQAQEWLKAQAPLFLP